MKTHRKYRILTLLGGIATAAVIVFSQLFYFQAATWCQKKAETQQKEKKEQVGHESYFAIPSHTISFGSHVEVSDAISFVLETLFVTEQEEFHAEVIQLTNSLFHTLFRFIIAPNAP